MSIPEKAVEWAVGIANDNSHGYDQASRWGKDYDCSSLVISAYKQAGVPLTCTYTGNMRSDMMMNGFAPVPTANLKTGTGLLPGDVLLNEKSHTAMYIGNGQIVHASGNEFGGATGGKTGDQTGKEIGITSYFNFPWDCVLRYCRKDDSAAQQPSSSADSAAPGTYIVQKGDTLWGIAKRFLGAGERYIQIMSLNNLNDSLIHPGQVLDIPQDSPTTVYRTIQVTVKSETLELLTIMAEGWDKTIGQVIDALMEDAV